MSVERKFRSELEAPQREILLYALAGESQFTIGGKLNLSAKSIETHLSVIRRRAYDAGLIDLADRLSTAFAGSGPSIAAPSAATARPHRILVVEDHPVNRILVELLLNPLGVDVETAWDGEEGFQRLRDGGFDLVIMDIDMPLMNGLEATRAIRALERERGQRPIPIVMLTSHGSQHYRQLASDAGADAYLTKPVEPEELLAAVDQFLRSGAAKAP